MPCAPRLLPPSILSVNQYSSIFLSLCLVVMAGMLTACGGDLQDSFSPSSAPGGGGSIGARAVATLAWDPVQDSTVYGYFVHYGKQSGGGSGNCPVGNSMFVSQPHVSITNLENGTQYFFSVSSYNGTESGCSNEVTTVTPLEA